MPDRFYGCPMVFLFLCYYSEVRIEKLFNIIIGRLPLNAPRATVNHHGRSLLSPLAASPSSCAPLPTH